MRSLYLRIYLTVVAALALFALVSGWLVQQHLDQERRRFELSAQDRVAAWAELLQRSLPGPNEPAAEQASALLDWSQRLRLPLALDNAEGRRIGASESFLRRERDPNNTSRGTAIKLDDGRTLRILRPVGNRMGPPKPPPDGESGAPNAGGRAGPGGPGGPNPGVERDNPPRLNPFSAPLGGLFPPGSALEGGLGLAILLVVLFAAVALGAWPVVRRLTRRLEALKQGVEAFGAGQLHQRVAEDGHDEVAALGASFNQAAGRIETLLRSHQSLLANASHELRSPLARLKMAVSMAEDATPEQRAALRDEINTNIGELDALVEEVLLASRLDAAATRQHDQSGQHDEPIELLPLAAEEAARLDVPLAEVDAAVEGLSALGEERLLRRALRNLLENARRYGGDDVSLQLRREGQQAWLQVLDRGPGVPEAFRERIFEPFFRLPGHAEREGGVGLGLALVRQIAQRHGGQVHCTPREGGGSCFTLVLPLA